jgi:hypothetical protein
MKKLALSDGVDEKSVGEFEIFGRMKVLVRISCMMSLLGPLSCHGRGLRTKERKRGANSMKGQGMLAGRVD